MLVSESENESGGTVGEDWEQPQKRGDRATGGEVDSGGDVDPLGDLKHVGPIRSCASMLLQYLHMRSSLEINCCKRAWEPVAIHVHSVLVVGLGKAGLVFDPHHRCPRVKELHAFFSMCDV